ncbi:MAG: hypothetical protein M3Y56_01580 [Armatimonadota bacterium]|nr:hypothetical protein [Armatimonadota bacterium]
MIHDSFSLWVDAEALPLQRAHPTWHRLDGWSAGGNREVVGRFRYADQVWVVHGDTRFNPVLCAYQALRSGLTADPFLIEQAKVRRCLNLKPEIRSAQLPKHFYVYEQV